MASVICCTILFLYASVLICGKSTDTGQHGTSRLVSFSTTRATLSNSNPSDQIPFSFFDKRSNGNDADSKEKQDSIETNTNILPVSEKLTDEGILSRDACLPGENTESGTITSQMSQKERNDDDICGTSQDINPKKKCDAAASSGYFRTLLNLMYSFSFRAIYASWLMKNALVTWYMNYLVANPILTKSVTAGIIGSFGDIIAQYVEFTWLKEKCAPNPKHQQIRFLSSIDVVRISSIFLEGIFVSGPLMHFAYDWLEETIPIHDEDFSDNNHKFPGVNDSVWTAGTLNATPYMKWLPTVAHVLADNIILAPFFVFTMMITTALIQGHSLASVNKELRTEYLSNCCASLVSSFLFVPVQLLAFHFLPVMFRVLYMNLQDIVWNAVVSYMVYRNRTKRKRNAL